MALLDTITAEACISVCDTTRTISEDDFLDYMLDALSASLGVPLTDLTGADIRAAVDTALCAMEGLKNSPIPVEQKRALFLALWATQ
jgi:hypothetical protein